VTSAQPGRRPRSLPRRPTIDDVAHLAGVSKGAVSLALNDRPGVSDGTRRRILAAADELGWRPSVRARALSESRALAVGLVLARPPAQLASDPFFAQLLAGVEAALAPAGYSLVLSVVPGGPAEAEAYRRLAEEGRIDGVLLIDARIDDSRYELISSLGLEAVVVGLRDESCPFPGVAVDERATIARAVRHLVDLGHTRIAHVGGPSKIVHAAGRRDAWREALVEAGLTPGRALSGGFTGEGGARATKQLLQGPDRPTAIFYASDAMAIAGLGVARLLGLRVPLDLSIVGFDDIPLAEHVTPPLTTIRQDPIASGRAAARLLLARLRDETAVAPALPPPDLIERDSTAPAPRA
jgi:DNA-binding LacI/PurR family transcriptional regulator